MDINQLKEVILGRIQGEIFSAHEALSIFTVISQNAKPLNASRWKHLFSIIQQQALGSFILSLGILFEKHDEGYPNYSIPTALFHLRQNVASINVPNQSVLNLEKFIRGQIDPSFSIAEGESLGKVPALICCHFKDSCPRIPARPGNSLDSAFDAIRVLRDKRVAHHEDHNLAGLPTCNMEGVLSLLCFAQTFVNIVGYSFFVSSRRSIALPGEFSTGHSISGSSMKRLIQKLELGNAGSAGASPSRS